MRASNDVGKSDPCNENDTFSNAGATYSLSPGKKVPKYFLKPAIVELANLFEGAAFQVVLALLTRSEISLDRNCYNE